MHKIVVPLVGLVVFALTLGGLMLFGPSAGSAAQPFLEALARRDYVAAAALRTERFQQAVSQADFERFLGQSKVGLFTSGSWSGWAIENGVSTFDGEINTATGERLPLRLSMLKEGGDWRIDAIRPLNPAGGDAALLPTPIEAVALIRDSTGMFARGVVAGDFSELHAAAAPEFTSAHSVADLAVQFKAFIDSGIDLRPLEEVAPNLSAQPALDAGGRLRLVGYYPAEDTKVDFDYQYRYHFTGWRLVSIELRVGPG